MLSLLQKKKVKDRYYEACGVRICIWLINTDFAQDYCITILLRKIKTKEILLKGFDICFIYYYCSKIVTI